jgi:hypothetical protein
MGIYPDVILISLAGLDTRLFALAASCDINSIVPGLSLLDGKILMKVDMGNIG